MSRELNYNDIIALFKKAENDLNEGWYVKSAWHDLCHAFNIYSITVKESGTLDKMILDNTIVQVISNMYMKIRARKESEEIKRVDDIFYLIGFAKVQMYLGKIRLSSPVIDKIYEDLENYFDDPEFFRCLGLGVPTEVKEQLEPTETNQEPTDERKGTVLPKDKIPKGNTPKKKKKVHHSEPEPDPNNLFYKMAQYTMDGMGLTLNGLDVRLGSGKYKMYSMIRHNFGWTKWSSTRLLLFYLYGGEKVTARAFREFVIEYINDEFKKSINGSICLGPKSRTVTRADAINCLDTLFPVAGLRQVINSGNKVVFDRYNELMKKGEPLTDAQKEFFSKFPSVTAGKLEPVVNSNIENRIAPTVESEKPVVTMDIQLDHRRRPVSLATAE